MARVLIPHIDERGRILPPNISGHCFNTEYADDTYFGSDADADEYGLMCAVEYPNKKVFVRHNNGAVTRVRA